MARFIDWITAYDHRAWSWGAVPAVFMLGLIVTGAWYVIGPSAISVVLFYVAAFLLAGSGVLAGALLATQRREPLDIPRSTSPGPVLGHVHLTHPSALGRPGDDAAR